MKTGQLLKSYGGFYYVFSDNMLYECRIRGRLQNKINRILPGEQVKFTVMADNKGVIEDFLPRKTMLKRPGIVNFDQLCIVASTVNPTIDFLTIDKFLATSEMLNVEAFIVINKIDLAGGLDMEERVLAYYRNTPYRIFFTSATEVKGLEKVYQAMKQTFTVLVGNSGVGKSSIINALIPHAEQKTNAISKKLNRGKNTTRYVELFPLDDATYIADSPGFSSLEVYDYISANSLPKLYPEYLERSFSCNFRDCIHINEPKCAVKEDLASGILSEDRYQNYKNLYDDLLKKEVYK